MAGTVGQLERWLRRNPLPSEGADVSVRKEYFARMPPAVEHEWNIRKAARQCEAPNFNASLVDRAMKRMARVDAMPPELRQIVYEHSLEVVQEFLNMGVTIPKRIKHLIDTVLANDFANGAPRFARNQAPEGRRNPVNRRMLVVPDEPTSEMIAASMAEVSTFDQRITKQEKHRRRLRVAIRAGAIERL